MSRLIFVLGIVALFAGCVQEGVVGGDVDEHGCKPSAGYSWCEAKQKCLRTWEEPCTAEDAMLIANKSNCTEVGNLTDSIMYNNYTKTWWIDLDAVKEGCAPACVVHDNGSAEVNWRCTGLVE